MPRVDWMSWPGASESLLVLLTLAGVVVPLVIAAAVVEWLSTRRRKTNGRP
jgi:hypothetical protein